MTYDLETELARKSIGPISEPKVGIDRAFLAEVLKSLRAKNALIAELKEGSDLCRCCGTPRNQFEPVERDGPAYTALRQAGIDRIKDQDEGFEAKRGVL